MTMNKIIKSTVVVMMVVMMTVAAYANSGKGNRGNKQGPPPEAIKACEGKQEGDSVTFTGRGGESLKATCQSMEGQLAAVPEGHKSHQ